MLVAFELKMIEKLKFPCDYVIKAIWCHYTKCFVRPWFNHTNIYIPAAIAIFFLLVSISTSVSVCKFCLIELLIVMAYKLKCKNALFIQPQIRNDDKENMSTPKRMTIKCTHCELDFFKPFGSVYFFLWLTIKKTTHEKRAKLNARYSLPIFLLNFFFRSQFCIQFSDWSSDISVNMEFKRKIQYYVSKIDYELSG